MITLYLIRHGECTYNIEGLIQGQLDSPLTELGKQQAEAAARRLALEGFNAIYASDLIRAHETAGIIAAYHGLPVQMTPVLREGHLGCAQGLTVEQFAQLYPAEYKLWQEDPIKHRPPGAERFEEVIERGRAFLALVRENHMDGEKIAAVSHGGFLGGLICAAFDLPVAFYLNVHTTNTGITIMDLGERPVLRCLNDACHLNGLPHD